jgi:hypothetical protein
MTTLLDIMHINIEFKYKNYRAGAGLSGGVLT